MLSGKHSSTSRDSTLTQTHSQKSRRLCASFSCQFRKQWQRARVLTECGHHVGLGSNECPNQCQILLLRLTANVPFVVRKLTFQRPKHSSKPSLPLLTRRLQCLHVCLQRIREFDKPFICASRHCRDGCLLRRCCCKRFRCSARHGVFVEASEA
jgi:hypothetical protein